MRWAWLAVAACLLGSPAAAHAQVFLASKPHPEFTIGPLFVRARVNPELGPMRLDVIWSLALPARAGAADVAQDLYLLWPGAVSGETGAPGPDPALAKYVQERGFDVIDEGRLPLFTRTMQRVDGKRPAAEPVAGGAEYVSFVRTGGALGLSAPATYVKVRWDPRMADPAWTMDLRLTLPTAIRAKPASWFEEVFRGTRHTLTLGFNDVRHRAVYPLYFEHRNRVVRLSEDPSQIVVNFAEADRLKIDEIFPPSASRRRSESLESTEVVSLFIDRSEGITPQLLTVQFGYFSGVQAWAPVLIPTLFFVLGNAAAVIVRVVAERLSKRWSGRVAFGRDDEQRARRSGVVLPRDLVARITPGRTTYDELIRLCGADVEEHESLARPDRRRLVYRGRRIVPQRRRALGWFATVAHWDVEDHEVEIELEKDVVRDVQARTRRSRLATPEST